jgi:hypothetical protein
VSILAIVSKTPFAVSGGSITGKDETADPRLEMREASFTSPSEASGKLDALTTKFKVGEGVTSCIREVTWTARTSAAAPAPTPTPTKAVTPTMPGAPGTSSAAPVVQLGSLRTLKLGRSISVPFRISAPAAVAGQLKLGARDAKRYKVGRVLGRATAAAGVRRLTFKPSAKTMKRLRRAKRLKATLSIQPAGGAGQAISVTLAR